MPREYNSITPKAQKFGIVELANAASAHCWFTLVEKGILLIQFE